MHRHGLTRAFHVLLVAVLPFLPSIAAAQESGKCFLWKVESKSAIVYLLGSVHMADDGLYPLDAAIETAFASSDRLVVEVDMEKVDRQRMGQLLYTKGMYGAGETLEKNLSKETLKKLEAFLARQEVPLTAVNKERPWLVSLRVSMQEVKRLGYSEKFGIDRHFLEKANQAKKEVLQLETAEAQIAALADIPEKLQDLLLLSALEDYSDARSFMERMLRAWKAGDAVAIDRLVRKTAHEDARLEPVMKKLFDERNLEMLGQIEKYLKNEETYFVVAGAGHMVGTKGLVRLLRDKGFKVEQVAKANARAPAGVK